MLKRGKTGPIDVGAEGAILHWHQRTFIRWKTWCSPQVRKRDAWGNQGLTITGPDLWRNMAEKMSWAYIEYNKSGYMTLDYDEPDLTLLNASDMISYHLGKEFEEFGWFPEGTDGWHWPQDEEEEEQTQTSDPIPPWRQPPDRASSTHDWRKPPGRSSSSQDWLPPPLPPPPFPPIPPPPPILPLPIPPPPGLDQRQHNWGPKPPPGPPPGRALKPQAKRRPKFREEMAEVGPPKKP